MQSNLNRIKNKVQSNDEKVTLADEQFLLAKELQCLGDIIGREYEFVWIENKIVGFRQKPIDIPTYINTIMALDKYKKMEAKQMKKKEEKIMAIDEIFINFRTNAEQFSKVMNAPLDKFQQMWKKSHKIDGAWKKNVKSGTKLGLSIRNIVHGLKGFRMEMLSVMFGGQMMASALWGLMQPAFEIVGVFDLLTSLLQILFLPIALLVLNDFIIPLFEWFTKLSPETQMFIGTIVLLSAVFFTLLGVFGSIVLFLGGLVVAWGALSTAILASPFGWLLITIGLIIAAIVMFGLAAYLIWKNWDSVFTWIKEHPFWSAVLFLISPIMAQFVLMTAISKRMEKVWSEVFTKTQEVMKPIGQWFETNVTSKIVSAWEYMMSVIRSGWDSIKGIWNTVTAGVSAIGGKIKGAVLGGRQTGGYVPHDGLYKLHAGETVSQQGTNNFMPSIVVNASSNVDIEMLKSQLSSQWGDELARLARR